MNRHPKKMVRLALALTPLLGAGLCPTRPPESGTFDIVVSKLDPQAAGIFILVANPELSRVDEIGPKLTALDSVSGKPSTRFILSGPLSVGQTAFTVRVADRNTPPSVTVLQAARGASGGFAMLSPSAFAFVPVLQRE